VTTVLITSGGRRVALVRAFQHALASLGGGRVLVADVVPTAAALHAADDGVLLPRCDDPACVPALVEVCRRRDVRLLVPTTDREQPMLVAAGDALRAAGVRVALSGPKTVAIAADKLATAAFFTRAEVATPRLLDVDAALRTPALRFPLVVKPRFGSGSIGVHVVRDHEELRFFLRRVPEPLLQEHCTGDEFTLDVLVGPGRRVACVVPRRRVETRAGEIAKGFTVRDAELERWGRHVAERLPDPWGPITLQCFRRPDAPPAFIEINTRFGGGFPLAAAAGADYARWLVEWTLGLPSTACADHWRGDVAMLRYDDALFLPCEALR
jgi:carbamoyl-phosphate synthase large subunit